MTPADDDDRRPLVIGIGNRFRGDDAAGLMVIDELAAEEADWLDTATLEGDLSGLMDLWHRDQDVIVVDAVSSGLAPGTIVVVDLLANHTGIGPSPRSTHGIGLLDAVGLARTLDRLPQSLLLLGIEADRFSVGDPVGPEVARATATLATSIPRMVQGGEGRPSPGGGSGPGAGQPGPACELCGPPITLRSGDVLTLRHTTAADAPALRELYQHLGPRDLTRRFFTAGPPSRRFVEHWADLEADGGLGLIAVTDDGTQRRVVGEAGYALIAEQPGEGELGITVRPKSRGWLGPWLLDRLLAHARERQIHNLQAVVLVENRTMIRLAAKRGFAVMGHPDWGTVRLTMSTGGSVPSWPGNADQPRVLIETNLGRWAGEEQLRDAGYQIMVCGAHCRGADGCPIPRGEACPLVDEADVVVVDLPDRREAEELVEQEQILHPGVQQVLRWPAGDQNHDRMSVQEVMAEVHRLLQITQDESGGGGPGT